MSIHIPIPADAPDMLRADQLAEWLDVTVMCIHRWAKQGKMPKPLRLGHRHVRWDKGQIIEWLKLSWRVSVGVANKASQQSVEKAVSAL